jgi:hypothetical protein
VFRTSNVGAPRPTNEKAARRRPVIDPVVCHERKIWSGRRGSNPRPRPWQGRALPLSYTRIRDGGDHSPSTADLCQMPTTNATVRVRPDDTRIIRFHEQIGANRSETTPKRGLSALKPTRELKIRLPARRGTIRAIFEPAARRPVDWSQTPQSQSTIPCEGPLAGLDGASTFPGVPAQPVSDHPEHACGLNFAAKPPSSG